MNMNMIISTATAALTVDDMVATMTITTMMATTGTDPTGDSQFRSHNLLLSQLNSTFAAITTAMATSVILCRLACPALSRLQYVSLHFKCAASLTSDLTATDYAQLLGKIDVWSRLLSHL